MKELLSLTFKDKKFKLKLLGYGVLFYILILIGMIVPMLFIASGNGALVFLGLILEIGLTLGLVFLCYLVICNRLMTHYYPCLKVPAKELLMKLLAIILITLPVVFGCELVIIILMLIGAVLGAGIFTLVVLALICILIIQGLAIAYSLFYIGLDQLEEEEYGFKVMFTGVVSKVKAARKHLVKMCIASLIYYIIGLILVYIVIIIITLLFTAIGMAIGLYAMIAVGGGLTLVFGAVVLFLMITSIAQYFMIHYGQVKKLIK